MGDKTNSSMGISFAIFMVFLMLKLGGAITWSWWIITLPLWFGVAAAIAIFLSVLIIIITVVIVALIVAGVYGLFACLIGLFRK